MRSVIALLYGPLVWAAHFAILYGTHASFCVANEHVRTSLSPLIPVFAPATALALLLASLPLAFPKRFAALFFTGRSKEEARFGLGVMRWLAGLSIVAVVANGIAVLLVPPC
ncbi:MAG: hypothetical protein ACOY4R_25020 [Pseudomonadota bacterium]